MISRYEDVLSVARDHLRFSNDPQWRNASASVLPPAADDYSILLVEGPGRAATRVSAPLMCTYSAGTTRTRRLREGQERPPSRRRRNMSAFRLHTTVKEALGKAELPPKGQPLPHTIEDASRAWSPTSGPV